MTTKAKTEVKPAKVEKAAKYASGGYADDAKIKILVKGNPKRPGSASAKRFALYKNGMKVSAAKASGLGPGDLRWDVAHGFIAIA
jgi:hypothetical protein